MCQRVYSRQKRRHMRNLSIVKALVGFSLLVLMVSGVLFIIRSQDSTAQVPQEIPRNTEAATVKVSTYRYTMDAWQTPQLEGDTDHKTFTEFTVVVGEGMHVITRVEGSDYQESLLLDGVQHFRSGPNEAWQSSYSSFDPTTMPMLEPREDFNLFSDLIDVRVLGEEQVNGVPTTKIQGTIDMQSKVEKIWGNPETQSPELSAGSEDPRGQFLAGSEEFTGWVGINDGLLHAYELHGSYPAFGELLQFEYSLRDRVL